MARPLRIEVAGGLYHVIARGNERKAVFRDDDDRTHYLNRLAHYGQKFSFRLIAYCLMDNHLHLAIQTGEDPLSRTMACLQSSYTQYFNRRHRRSGHLFQGRYKAFLVEKDAYALALVRYIHENPWKAGVVERPETYSWSSDRFYRSGKGTEWLDVDFVLSMLAPRRDLAMRQYRQLMRGPQEDSYEQVASWGQAVKGDEVFADRMLQAAGEPPIVPRGITLERVASRVADAEGVELKVMRSVARGRRESRARHMTGWLAREVGRISGAQVAKYFSRDTATMAKGLTRLNEMLAVNHSLRRRLDRLAAELRR